MIGFVIDHQKGHTRYNRSTRLLVLAICGPLHPLKQVFQDRAILLNHEEKRSAAGVNVEIVGYCALEITVIGLICNRVRTDAGVNESDSNGLKGTAIVCPRRAV